MILVTGACGYIGSHFVLACRDAGHRVVALDDLSTGHLDALPTDVPLLWGDFADPDLIARAVREFGADRLVHFAAKISVPESIAEPDLYWRENAHKTEQLVRIATLHGLDQMVFSSTAAVYGTPDRARVSEECPTHPLSPYGETKLAAERAIRAATGLRHVILRYFNVAGADPMRRAGPRAAQPAHLFGRLCAVATGEYRAIEVFGTDYPTPDGSAIRDFLHVSDLAQAHLDALDYLAAGGESATLNCGYGHGTSVFQAIEIMRRVSGHPIPARLLGRRAGDIAEIIADAAAIRQRLGWTPRYEDLERIARDALEFRRLSGPDQRDTHAQAGSARKGAARPG